MEKIWDIVLRFFADREGASGIEYAIVAAMVAVVLAFFITPIGTRVRSIFSEICTSIGAAGCVS